MRISKAIKFFKKYRFGILVFVLLAIGAFVARPQLSQVINVSSNTRKLPIYCVDTPEKKVSISFDAAWGADDTDDLIKILEDNNVKATFFLVGDWVKNYPEQTKKLAAAGHEIGNHSNKHPHMSKLTHEQIKSDIMKAHNNIKELLGIDMILFRPPFGEYNNTVLDAAKECGYYTIQWDIDSLDWKKYGVEHEVNQVLNHKHLGNGSIILFHNDAKYTPASLDTIIKGIKAKGYEIVPISQLIHKNGFYLDHEGRQKLNK